MSELDELERLLLAAADTWFSAPLHRKLTRLIEIAREGQAKRDSIVREAPLQRETVAAFDE